MRGKDLVPVLHLINGEHYAGAERVQDLLAERLPEFGYRVSFALAKPGRFAAARRSDAPTRETPMRGKADLRPVRAVRALIRRDGVRLVHTHTPRTAILGRLATFGTAVPMVHHVHSEAADDSTRWLVNTINVNATRLSLRGIHHAIACSPNTRAYALRLGVPEERLSLIPNGVPAWDSLPERDAPDGCWTLGTVALFRPPKGLEVMLEALARLRDRGCAVRLRAVGGFETPEYERSIKALARSLEVDHLVEWLPFTTDVSGELARMDVYVLPSIGEALPMAVLEAMAAGLPVVATNVGAVPQAVRHGQDGLIVPPGDACAFAGAVEQIVSGQRDWASMRQSALAQHSANFSDRRMAERVAEVYDAVLGRR